MHNFQLLFLTLDGTFNVLFKAVISHLIVCENDVLLYMMIFLVSEQKQSDLICAVWLVGWFCCFTSQVNSYGHCGTVSSPNHTFPGQAGTSG